jgi:hypothetical protein
MLRGKAEANALTVRSVTPPLAEKVPPLGERHHEH